MRTSVTRPITARCERQHRFPSQGSLGVSAQFARFTHCTSCVFAFSAFANHSVGKSDVHVSHGLLPYLPTHTLPHLDPSSRLNRPTFASAALDAKHHITEFAEERRKIRGTLPTLLSSVSWYRFFVQDRIQYGSGLSHVLTHSNRMT